MYVRKIVIFTGGSKIDEQLIFHETPAKNNKSIAEEKLFINYGCTSKTKCIIYKQKKSKNRINLNNQYSTYNTYILIQIKIGSLSLYIYQIIILLLITINDVDHDLPNLQVK